MRVSLNGREGLVCLALACCHGARAHPGEQCSANWASMVVPTGDIDARVEQIARFAAEPLSPEHRNLHQPEQRRSAACLNVSETSDRIVATSRRRRRLERVAVLERVNDGVRVAFFDQPRLRVWERFRIGWIATLDCKPVYNF